MIFLSFFLLSLLCLGEVHGSGVKRSFTIDYSKNTFLKDGKPFRYISSSLHYFRVPQFYWKDRMAKLKYLGIDTIQTYIEWSQHEQRSGEYNFVGQNDLVAFIKMAHEMGFLVILRPGPYIDAERDFGGLPYWLLKNKSMKLRSSDASFMVPVTSWLNVVLPKLKPLLYANGGPIISVQVENEYGSYFTHDRVYTTKLRDIIRNNLGSDVILFTTDGDGASYLKYGTVPDVYATVDFGSGGNVSNSFAVQRNYEKQGPLVNSEYYPGWLDHWGHPHANVPAAQVSKTLDQMLAYNASVNIYVAHGGTSFGFLSGANGGGNSYLPCPTSYDYDAPISEAGDLTPKFYSMRNVIKKYKTIPDAPPKPTSKMQIGPIQLKKIASLMPHLVNMSSVQSLHPLTFEDLDQAYGYVAYSTIVKTQHRDPETLNIQGIRDRGYIFVDNKMVGILSRGENIFSVGISIAKNQKLSILVENQGRLCYGTGLNDPKGIVSKVLLGNEELLNWTMVKVQLGADSMNSNILSTLNSTKLESDCNSSGLPAFYGTIFTLPAMNSSAHYPLDTFVRLDGWHKGIVLLNAHNLGRYWPVMGPQVTLYAPKYMFNPHPKPNSLIVLEFEGAPCQQLDKCTVQFVDTPELNGPTPK